MGSREYIEEPIGLPEFFVDGWGDRSNDNGVYSCVGYRCIRGVKIAVVRLTMRTETAREAIATTHATLNPDIGTNVVGLAKMLS